MTKAQAAARDLAYSVIANRYGLRNSLRALQEARKLGIGPALALAMIEQESGGRNVFGHDPTIFSGAGYVTKNKYLAYRAARRRSGNRLMQGVGPMQLTWWETQDRADALGGCWRSRINIRTGFITLAALIHAHGEREGIARYNGSGPRAQEYARSVLAKRARWRKRLWPHHG